MRSRRAASRVADVDGEARLKIAVQKSGRLTENSLDLLVRCGLKYSRGKDQLLCYGENMPLDVLLVRDDEDLPHVGGIPVQPVRAERERQQAQGIPPDRGHRRLPAECVGQTPVSDFGVDALHETRWAKTLMRARPDIAQVGHGNGSCHRR